MNYISHIHMYFTLLPAKITLTVKNLPKLTKDINFHGDNPFVFQNFSSVFILPRSQREDI